MELLLLDSAFDELGRVDNFESLQWTSRYYDVGSYKLILDISAFDLLMSAVYLYRPDSGQLAWVEDILYKVSDSGKQQLQITGRLIESLLDDRVIDTESNYTGTVAEIARQIVKKYFVDTAGRQFASLQIGTIPSLTESISRQYMGDKVGVACYELLREAELSQRIRFDYLNNTLIYEVWQGLDRTQNQIANEWAIFSDNMETITDFGYERDITDHCNFAYVVGDEITVEIDQTHGARRRELYVRGSTSRKNDDGSAMTDAQYREKLRQEGLEKLKDKQMAEVLNGTANSKNLQYRVDYNLGDLCTCINQQIGKLTDKRIVEVKEVFEDGNVEILPKFGEDTVTITSLIRRAGL